MSGGPKEVLRGRVHLPKENKARLKGQIINVVFCHRRSLEGCHRKTLINTLQWSDPAVPTLLVQFDWREDSIKNGVTSKHTHVSQLRNNNYKAMFVCRMSAERQTTCEV